jgi:hypothetical protein
LIRERGLRLRALGQKTMQHFAGAEKMRDLSRGAAAGSGLRARVSTGKPWVVSAIATNFIYKNGALNARKTFPRISVPNGLAPFLAWLFVLNFFRGNFPLFSLWLPEQFETRVRPTASALCTSFGRFVGACRL